MRILLATLAAAAFALPAMAQDSPGEAPAPACAAAAASDARIALAEEHPDLVPVAERPLIASLLVARARQFKSCDDKAAAAKDLALAVSLQPDDPNILVVQGLQLTQDGAYTQAVDAFTAALSHPSMLRLPIATVYADRAAAEDETKVLYSNEIQDLNAALSSNPNAIDAVQYRERRAVAYWDMGDYAHAKADFAAIMANDSDNWRNLYYYGLSLLKLGDADQAIAKLNLAELGRARDTGENTADMKLAIEIATGQAYAARHGPGDNLEARRRFEAALADSPGNADARAGLASLPQTPPKPAFDEPALLPIDTPQGIDTNSPPTFCDQEHKNAFLRQIAKASTVANQDLRTIRSYIDGVLTPMLDQYTKTDLLDQKTKNEYLAIINREWQAWLDKDDEYHKLSDPLLPYWHRVDADASLVVKCDQR
jgi:tetratricopeptide (TPR) repeat protein